MQTFINLKSKIIKNKTLDLFEKRLAAGEISIESIDSFKEVYGRKNYIHAYNKVKFMDLSIYYKNEFFCKLKTRSDLNRLMELIGNPFPDTEEYNDFLMPLWFSDNEDIKKLKETYNKNSYEMHLKLISNGTALNVPVSRFHENAIVKLTSEELLKEFIEFLEKKHCIRTFRLYPDVNPGHQEVIKEIQDMYNDPKALKDIYEVAEVLGIIPTSVPEDEALVVLESREDVDAFVEFINRF